MGSPYGLVASDATAAEFHGRAVPEPARPEVWWHRVTGPALVLGSAQPEAVVDHDACRRAGVDVVRRRSGGGAVLLLPGEVTWVDVIVPRGGTGWADDVHAPMVWLGRHLAAAFAELGVAATVHDRKLMSTRWSSLVCFDGVGPGELLVGAGKLVGISQRRTRHWARLQSCWYSHHDHGDMIDLLAAGERPDPRALGAVATVPAELAARVPAVLASRLDP